MLTSDGASASAAPLVNNASGALDIAEVNSATEHELSAALTACTNAVAVEADAAAFENQMFSVLGAPAVALDGVLLAPPVDDEEANFFEREGFSGSAVVAALALLRTAQGAPDVPAHVAPSTNSNNPLDGACENSGATDESSSALSAHENAPHHATDAARRRARRR